MHWAPTERSRAALLAEGIPAAKIALTGNTVVDAQQWVCDKFGIRREAAPGSGQILVTTRVCAAIEDEIATEPAGDLQLKGFMRPVTALNVVGPN